MYVLTPMPNIAFLCPGRINASPPAACPRTPASHSQGHARDANGTWRSGQLRMDFHLSRLAVNVYVSHILNSQLLTDRPSRTRGITLHQPF
jgi:hypothetical protein